jgi:hypothetical protein
MAAGAGWMAQHHLPGHAKTSAGRRVHAEIDSRFISRLREAASAYSRYALVNQSPAWAPTMCAAPGPPAPGPGLLFSRASTGEAHGGKLYFLYAADVAAYRQSKQGKAGQGTGQVLVKESWLPRPVPRAAAAGRARAIGPHGEFFEPGERGPLFVMLKLDPTARGTDRGWVYGTLTPDGWEVTSAGRVVSCMGCHDRGTHDRLFGPAR